MALPLHPRGCLAFPRWSYGAGRLGVSLLPGPGVPTGHPTDTAVRPGHRGPAHFLGSLTPHPSPGILLSSPPREGKGPWTAAHDNSWCDSESLSQKAPFWTPACGSPQHTRWHPLSVGLPASTRPPCRRPPSAVATRRHTRSAGQLTEKERESRRPGRQVGLGAPGGPMAGVLRSPDAGTRRTAGRQGPSSEPGTPARPLPPTARPRRCPRPAPAARDTRSPARTPHALTSGGPVRSRRSRRRRRRGGSASPGCPPAALRGAPPSPPGAREARGDARRPRGPGAACAAARRRAAGNLSGRSRRLLRAARLGLRGGGGGPAQRGAGATPGVRRGERTRRPPHLGPRPRPAPPRGREAHGGPAGQDSLPPGGGAGGRGAPSPGTPSPGAPGWAPTARAQASCRALRRDSRAYEQERPFLPSLGPGHQEVAGPGTGSGSCSRSGGHPVLLLVRRCSESRDVSRAGAGVFLCKG